MPIRVLMVLDENFRFAPYDGDTRPDRIRKFNYTVLVDSLEADGSIVVTKANRDPDPTADIDRFTFDGATNLVDFDLLWLIGDAGFNTESASGAPISAAENRAIAEFMEGGGGVFATGDHDGIGSYMCGWLPRVRAMRKWFALHDTTANIPVDFYIDDAYTVRNWPAVGPKRADTIRNNAHGDGTAWFENQSDSTPQVINPTTTPAHAILQGTDGEITVFPDHMHEGGCIAGFPGFSWDQTLTFDGSSFVEFPTVAGHQEKPEVIATGIVQSHPTPSVRGDPFPQAQAAEPRDPYGVFSAYDGFRSGVGRIITGSTFHHYVDLNLTGDALINTASEIASVGEDAQDGEGFDYAGASDVFDDIKTVYVNIAKWLARPRRSTQLILDRSTFGQAEVAAVSGGTFPESVYVVVEGLKPGDFPSGGITTFSPSEAQLSAWAPAVQPADANIRVEPTGIKGDQSSLPDSFQRFTFEYRVRFLNDTPFTSFGAGTREVSVAASLTASGVTLTDFAQFKLIKSANPYMLDLAENSTHHWLSSDIRVFPVVARSGEGIAGQFLDSDSKSAAYNFLQRVLNNISSSQFSDLPTDPVESTLSQHPLTTSGDIVYNFAIARVRVRANTGDANNVRVFFRIFEAQTTALTYRTPGGGPPIEGYKKYNNPDPIAAPGTNGTETQWISFPCFAADRAPSPTDQRDGQNVKKIESGSGSGEVHTYFGCLLDNNLTETYLPSEPGGFGAQSLADLLMGSHQCLVAQIEYDPAPIPDQSQPSSSDKLSQRNVAVSTIANPGTAASRAAFHTFEIEKTSHWDLAGRMPDELMLETLEPVPAETIARVYIPGLSAQEVVEMANQLYARHDLRAFDDHTVECPVGGINYIPLPPNASRQVGLIKVIFPEGIKRGQRFDLVVRQITNKSRSVPIKPPRVKVVKRKEAEKLLKTKKRTATAADMDLTADNPDLTYFPSLTMLNIDSEDAAFIETAGAAEAYQAAANPWREVVGSFQMAVPVSVKSDMLVEHLRLLSVFYWRLDRLKTTNRWYLVIKQFVDELADKVRALGGDPLAVPATPDAWWPGLSDGKDGGDEPGGDTPTGGGEAGGGFPDYGAWTDNDKDDVGLSRTGKISGIARDHFGDFEAFFLEDHNGDHFRYLCRERAVLDTVWEAWQERYTITVHSLSGKPQEVRQIIMRGYN